MDYIYDPGANGSQSNQLQKMTYGSDSISYTYDNNGNITSMRTEDGTVTYEYDELYRLIREDNQILDQTIAYIYTFDGDLCRKKIYDYMPDTDLWMPQEIQSNETILYEYTADGLNLLTEYDGQTITYDAIGNPLQYRGMNLTWSNGRELYSVSKNGTTTTYRYNKDGMRNRKYLGDGTVIYQIQRSLISGEQKIGQDEQSLVYELEYYYDSNGNILSMLYNGTEYYYLKNIQGDIIRILDGSGASVVEYSYDSWGKVIEISGNQELGKRNPFRYRGYYYDEETGFYYVGSRYYDPEICRFINADTVDILGVQDNLNDKNLYVYCDNNPVMRVDTTGQFWNIASGAIIGASISIGVELTSQLIDYAISGSKLDVTSVIIAGIGGAAGGALAATGFGKRGQAIGNAIISGMGEVVSQIHSGNRNVLSIAKHAGIMAAGGAASVVVGGKGIRAEGEPYRQSLDKLRGLKGNVKKALSNPKGYRKQLNRAIKKHSVITRKAVKNTTKAFGKASIFTNVWGRLQRLIN